MTPLRQTVQLTLPLLSIALVHTPVPAAELPLETVVIEAVAHFPVDGATVHAADRAAMLAKVSRLGDVTWQTVTAVGHTDSTGPVAHNQRLAQRRATAVKTYLVGKGLDASMVRTEGRASTQPVADNRSDAGRASNRRTEIQFRGIRTATR